MENETVIQFLREPTKRKKALEYLSSIRRFEKIDRELLLNVARTSLKTKLTNDMANQ